MNCCCLFTPQTTQAIAHATGFTTSFDDYDNVLEDSIYCTLSTPELRTHFTFSTRRMLIFVIKAINQIKNREQNREQNDTIRNEREGEREREPARISIRQILKMEFFRKPQNAIHKNGCQFISSFHVLLSKCLSVYVCFFCIRVSVFVLFHCRRRRRHRLYSMYGGSISAVSVAQALTSFSPNICWRTNRFFLVSFSYSRVLPVPPIHIYNRIKYRSYSCHHPNLSSCPAPPPPLA